MQLQQQISAKRLQKKVSRKILVIINKVNKKSAISRSIANAPKINSAVYLNSKTNVKPSNILRVKVKHANKYNL